jgi:hypothetical protein
MKRVTVRPDVVEVGILVGRLLNVDQREADRSTIITTNLAFSEWVEVFGDEKLTTALLDRLSQHAHTLTTRGDSFRSQRATKAAASGAKKEAHADDSEAR